MLGYEAQETVFLWLLRLRTWREPLNLILSSLGFYRCEGHPLLRAPPVKPAEIRELLAKQRLIGSFLAPRA